MRLVFVMDSPYAQGGIEKATAYLISGLLHLCDVAVLSSDSAENELFWKAVGCEWLPTHGLSQWRIGRSHLCTTVSTFRSVRRAVKDLVLPSDALITTHMGGEILLGLGKPPVDNPRVFVVHNTNYGGPSSKILGRSLRTCRGFVAINSLTARALERLGQQANCIVPNCLPLGYTEQPSARDFGHVGHIGQPIRLAIVGPVIPLKNQALAAEACRLLLAEGLDFRLSFKGVCPSFVDEAYLTSLRCLVSDAGFGSRLDFVGYTHSLEELYADVDILLSLSQRESFGMSILEAMGRGIPVISTRSGGPEYLIRSEENGVLIQASPNELAQWVLKLARDPGLCARLSANAQQSSRAYDAKIVAPEFLRSVMQICTQ